MQNDRMKVMITLLLLHCCYVAVAGGVLVVRWRLSAVVSCQLSVVARGNGENGRESEECSVDVCLPRVNFT